MKRNVIVLIAGALLAALTGCSPSAEQPAAVKEEPKAAVAAVEKPFFTFKDMAGSDVVLPKKPERIVVLATETLDLFYQLGGKAVGRASAPGTPVSEEQRKAQDVGQVNNVSIEKIAALNPDLVIGQYYFNAGLKETFAASGVPFALLKITSYEDVQQVGKLYGQILGKPAEAEQALKEADARVQAVTGKAPDRKTTFAQVTIMPMGIYIQKDGSTISDIARRLKLSNAAEGMISGEWPDYVPYSLEKLIQSDPDYLFMVVHGTEEYGKKKLKDNMESNPAWASLRAVKENRLYFLPDGFEKTPGLHLDEAFEYMAKLVYPDVYGK
ncbi:ABC transporter substrate-binding protein [Paenibacillus hamazuiensis]|uniref:ABC transporter substrate-binding protein n=1 Tax=Paenibacillus hamazuiensis TaxID=2936508 RepID=UPI00200D1D38|nr:ABC transporter substrate-binding protein [Paenibacillus hamazuiensis]